MRFTTEQLLAYLKEMMEKNPRINQRVLELNLTNEEAIEALPIIIEMASESEETKSHYLTSFDRTENGSIRKIDVLSKEGKRKAYLENVKTLSIYPLDFEESKDYEKLEERRIVVNEFSKFLKDDSEGIVSKGFYIYGQPGVGKTFTLKRFAKSLAEKGRQIGFVPAHQLVSIFQKSFGSNANDDSKESIIETLKKVDYLFIDDIGSESISTWFRDDILFQILSDRNTNRKATFFSSNYDYSQLTQVESKTAKEKYKDFEKAERIVTRVKMLTIPIELKGKPRI